MSIARDLGFIKSTPVRADIPSVRLASCVTLILRQYSLSEALPPGRLCFVLGNAPQVCCLSARMRGLFEVAGRIELLTNLHGSVVLFLCHFPNAFLCKNLITFATAISFIALSLLMVYVVGSSLFRS